MAARRPFRNSRNRIPARPEPRPPAPLAAVLRRRFPLWTGRGPNPLLLGAPASRRPMREAHSQDNAGGTPARPGARDAGERRNPPKREAPAPHIPQFPELPVSRRPRSRPLSRNSGAASPGTPRPERRLGPCPPSPARFPTRRRPRASPPQPGRGWTWEAGQRSEIRRRSRGKRAGVETDGFQGAYGGRAGRAAVGRIERRGEREKPRIRSDPVRQRGQSRSAGECGASTGRPRWAMAASPPQFATSCIVRWNGCSGCL